MTFDIQIISHYNFLTELEDNHYYFGDKLDKNQIKKRLDISLEQNGLIFLVKKSDKITCFFTYRPMKSFPSWSLSNLFITSHRFFSPNMLGFGPAMDLATDYGEKNNLFSFFYVCEKKTFHQRYLIGMRDIIRRQSLLKNYTFHIVQDSTLHKGYDICDYLTGSTNLETYLIMASKNINLS